MRRRVYSPVAILGACAALAAALLVPALDTPAAPVEVYPKVEKHTHKSYEETIPTTKVKFEMIAVPGGTYMMGSPKDEKDRKDDEGPQHPVTVKGFWMGKCEVTWDEYDTWWRNKNKGAKEPEKKDKDMPDAVTSPTPPYADETFGHGREGHPVLCVTHHSAMEYCRWLSEKTGKIYRLPTEAEWEWACRAGTNTAYSFGDDANKVGDYAWYEGNSEEITHVVGGKKANPWGLFDMHGNVAEWCIDHYTKDYTGFSLDKATLQPVTLPTEKRFSHVARGGAWSDKAALLRSAARRGSDKKWIKQDPQRPQSIWWLTDAEFVGFRIVRPLEEQDNLKNIKSKVTKESD